MEAAGSCHRREMWFSAGRPLGFTAAKCPSGALGLEPNREQLAKIAICQSSQIISNPRAGTWSFSCFASSIPQTLPRIDLHSPGILRVHAVDEAGDEMVWEPPTPAETDICFEHENESEALLQREGCTSRFRQGLSSKPQKILAVSTQKKDLDLPWDEPPKLQ